MSLKSINYLIENTDILKLEVILEDKKYTIDMKKELEISETTVTSALKSQPTHYAFLATIHRRALVIKREKERNMDKIYSSLFSKIKDGADCSKYPRGMSKDMVEAKVNKNIKYLKAKKEYEKVISQVEILELYVRAFEQRSSLIQTLSANMRKETL